MSSSGHGWGREAFLFRCLNPCCQRLCTMCRQSLPKTPGCMCIVRLGREAAIHGMPTCETSPSIAATAFASLGLRMPLTPTGGAAWMTSRFAVKAPVRSPASFTSVSSSSRDPANRSAACEREWRRGWDSNPRTAFWAVIRFRVGPVTTSSVPLRRMNLPKIPDLTKPNLGEDVVAQSLSGAMLDRVDTQR